MGKVSRNRKGLKPETVVTLWNDLKTKLTIKELCNVLELPRSTFYRWLQRTEDLKEDIEEKVKDVCLRHRFPVWISKSDCYSSKNGTVCQS